MPNAIVLKLSQWLLDVVDGEFDQAMIEAMDWAQKNSAKIHDAQALSSLQMAFEAIKPRMAAEALLALGADPDARRATGSDNGDTPLMIAARQGSVELIELFAPICDTSARGMFGRDALMIAAERGQIECVRAMLPFCDAKAKDNKGRTALMHAVIVSDEPCVELLLPASDALARANLGESALMLAAAIGSTECLLRLLPVSDPLAQDNEGMSALMRAADKGRVDRARLLLPVSDPLARDLDGRDAFERAVLGGRWAVADLLGSFVGEARLKDAINCAPPEQMPHSRALLDRRSIVEAIDLPEGSSAVLAVPPRNPLRRL
jgi:ankyrin repeat protein